jgi:adenylate kinase family enzyme
MERIIVIGCPGSGKSTLSRRLREITGLPLFYLDMIFHKEDRTTVSREEFDERLNEILVDDKWIIDGNYLRTMEVRVERADTVIWLDYPTSLCLEGIKERKGKKREDMPWVEIEFDEEFIEFVKGFNEHSRPKIIEILEKYRDKSIYVFTSREETEEFLQSLKD